MNDLLERAVKSALDDLVATTPPTPDVPIRRSDASPPNRAWLAIAAALIIGLGAAGLWAAAGRAGDQTAPTDPPPPTAVVIGTTTTIAAQNDDRGYDPAENEGFATYYAPGPVSGIAQSGPMPSWPDKIISGELATHVGYGLALCSSFVWEKDASLESADGPIHSYVGTLCPHVVLGEMAPDTVATCSNLTPDWLAYARCQHLTDDPVSDAPPAAPESDQGATVLTIVDEGAYTPVEEPSTVFDGGLSAVGSTTAVGNAISVTPAGVDERWHRCYQIELPEAMVFGCLDEWVFLDGLAYGAFRAEDGPLEIIGIVPDDVATVEIGGTTIQVENNVWHYSDPAAARPRFTVYSADRSRSASIGEAASAG